MFAFIVRLILTVGLIFGVYLEAGPFTAICLFLIFAGFELSAATYRELEKTISNIGKIPDRHGTQK